MSTVLANTINAVGGGRSTAKVTVTNDSTYESDGGTVTDSNLVQGLIKCWVTIDGDASDATTLDTFNVSGLTDNGSGDYTIAIDNDMGNANYCYTTAIKRNNDTADGNVTLYQRNSGTKSGAELRVTANFNAGGSTGVFDPPEAYVQITGDLA